MPVELRKIINVIPKKNPGFSVCSLPVTEGEGLRLMCPSLRLHTGLVVDEGWKNIFFHGVASRKLPVLRHANPHLGSSKQLQWDSLSPQCTGKYRELVQKRKRWAGLTLSWEGERGGYDLKSIMFMTENITRKHSITYVPIKTSMKTWNLGDTQTVQSLKCWPWKHKALIWSQNLQGKMLLVMVHIWNPRAGETEADHKGHSD